MLYESLPTRRFGFAAFPPPGQDGHPPAPRRPPGNARLRTRALARPASVCLTPPFPLALAFALALCFLLPPAAAASFWPFGSETRKPARLVWNDGSATDVLFSGFEHGLPPPPPQGAADAWVGQISLGRQSHAVLVPRVRDRDGETALLLHPLTVQSFEFLPVEVRHYGSDTSAQWFSLGSARERIPPPPDWFLAREESPVWRPARLAPVLPTWTYLPGAAWLWNSSDLRPAEGERVLFRQRFQIPENRTLLRAELWIEADNVLEEAYLNGHPLPWSPKILGGKAARAYVERLLRPGSNHIALCVTAPQTGGIDAACVAWRLQVVLAPADAHADTAAPPPFTVRTIDGGWLPANRVHLSDTRVDLHRPVGGRITLDRAAVRWIEHWADGDIEPATPAPLPRRSPPRSAAIDALYDEVLEAGGLWTATGGFLRGHVTDWSPHPQQPTAMSGGGLRWREDPRPASESVGDLRAVLASPAPGETRWDLPASDLARQARVLLRDGALLTGLLAPASGGRIAIELPGNARVVCSLDDIARIEFPTIPALRARWAFDRLAHGSREARIAFVGELACRGGPGCPDSIVPPIVRTAQAMGVETHWLQPQQLIAPDDFTPERFPVVLNVDQSEAYYHTIQRSGDGHHALQRYMNEGGVLIHLAPGAPFTYGRQAHARQWAMVPLGGGLNRAFGLEIASPGAATAGVTFEVPENDATPLEFLKVADGAWGDGLPARVTFPCLSDSRFRPVSPEPQRAGAQVIPLYRLIRGNKNLGLAAAAVRYPGTVPDRPPAYMVYLSWPLAQARDEFGESLLPRILPSILEAIAKDRVANTLRSPDGDPLRHAAIEPRP